MVLKSVLAMKMHESKGHWEQPYWPPEVDWAMKLHANYLQDGFSSLFACKWDPLYIMIPHIGLVWCFF